MIKIKNYSIRFDEIYTLKAKLEFLLKIPNYLFFLVILILPIEALANNCNQLPQKIKDCEKFTCKAQTDKYNFIVTHNVIGKTPNGKCSYKSTVPIPPGAPNDLFMNCLFTKNVREAYGNVLSKTLGLEKNRNIIEDNKIVNQALAKDACEIEGLELIK